MPFLFDMNDTQKDPSAWTGLGVGGLLGAAAMYHFNGFVPDLNIASLYGAVSVVKSTAILLTPPCTAQLMGTIRTDFAKAEKGAAVGAGAVAAMLFGLGTIDRHVANHNDGQPAFSFTQK